MGHRSGRSVIRAVTAALVPAVLFLALAVTGEASGAPGADGGAEASASRGPPDPPPTRERAQWLVDLRWVRGDVYLVSMSPTDFSTPRETPRVMGRFALELYEGSTLIERVRFDFPMLGADEPEAGVPMSRKLTTRIGVLFPAIRRGTQLELLDRATDTRWPLPWPPAASSPPTDAGRGGS